MSKEEIEKTPFLKNRSAKQIKRDEAFLAKSDGARFLYLLARETEWASKEIERTYRKGSMSLEEKEALWREANMIIDECDSRLREVLVKIMEFDKVDQ
jgi:hypothetical protein